MTNEIRIETIGEPHDTLYQLAARADEQSRNRFSNRLVSVTVEFWFSVKRSHKAINIITLFEAVERNLRGPCYPVQSRVAEFHVTRRVGDPKTIITIRPIEEEK